MPRSRTGNSRPTASRIAWPSALVPSSRSMTWAPSVPAPALARVARAPVRTTAPSRSSAKRTVSAFRGCSVGTRREPDCTMVVGTPKRTKTWASSQPVGPPPRTSRLRGSSRVSVACSLVQGCVSARPSIGGTLDVDPTATMTSRAASSVTAPSSPVTETRPRSVIRPVPRNVAAPARSSDRTWELSSGSAAPAGRLTM